MTHGPRGGRAVQAGRVRPRLWFVPHSGGVVLATCFVLAACASAADPSPGDVSAERLPLGGFGETALEVRSVAGTVAIWCALLADDDASRAQGLMGQRDLRGYDAMVFRHPADATGAYYMYRTLVPLSIAWFDGAGAFVSSADMTPCPSDDPAVCPRYRAAGPYRFAVEVLRGDLTGLGIGPGAQLTVLDTLPCDPPGRRSTIHASPIRNLMMRRTERRPGPLRSWLSHHPSTVDGVRLSWAPGSPYHPLSQSSPARSGAGPERPAPGPEGGSTGP